MATRADRSKRAYSGQYSDRVKRRQAVLTVLAMAYIYPGIADPTPLQAFQGDE